MKKMFDKYKIPPGVFLMMLGVFGLVGSLASTSLSTFEKVPITIMCLVVMIIGVLVHSPQFTLFNAEPVEQETFSDW